jgi:curli biogenesis system outer membrane secretion channel CsgG
MTMDALVRWSTIGGTDEGHAINSRGSMRPRHLLSLVVALGGCGGVQVGSDSARTPVTGSAAGAVADGAMGRLERCDRTLGTLTVNEDQSAPWYRRMRNEYKLESTVPLIRLLAQQSNCFAVVERGRAFQSAMRERRLEESGELREGSSFQKGQMAAADYTLTPEITFSSKDSGGVRGGVAAAGRRLGALGTLGGALASDLKFREAATTLTLIDNRSTVQLAAAEGAASKTDFGAWGRLFGSSAAGKLGGYTKTPEGKMIAGAFADAFCQLVKSMKSYKAQEVSGGLGTGGTLGVQGGATPASQDVGR